VLGIDPGLTRCGVGVVDVLPDRRVSLVYVGVIRTPADAELPARLLAVSEGIAAAIAEHRPDAVAVERVFAQQNLRTVMGTAQASGIAVAKAAEAGLPVALLTGYGSADKAQVGAMVARVLGLAEIPRPADAADALALAICHGWRGGATAPDAGSAGGLTPAQRAWRDAEKSAGKRRL